MVSGKKYSFENENSIKNVLDFQDPETGELCYDPTLLASSNSYRSASSEGGGKSSKNSQQDSKNKNAPMPSQSIMSENNVDNYDEGWYQDESGNWLNQYNWMQDASSGEWYYDESYYPGGTSGSDQYEGWMQDANGEWIEDPNYDPGAKTNSATATDSSATSTKTQVLSTSSTGAKSNGDVSNQKQVAKDIEQNGVNKGSNSEAVVAATVTIKEDSTNASDSKVAKLPPRPADYDYYWYQDEDGNWRNEYDDYG